MEIRRWLMTQLLRKVRPLEDIVEYLGTVWFPRDVEGSARGLSGTERLEYRV